MKLIAVGKEGTVYVLNRDNMGQLCSTCTTIDTQIVQELLKTVGCESGTPVYWNNTVYFTGTAVPVMAFTLSNGSLVVPPSAQSVKVGGGGHALVTANGNSNGVLWFNNGNSLWAMDAGTLKTLYTSGLAPNGRDTLPPLAHFATPIVADGKVFFRNPEQPRRVWITPGLVGDRRQRAVGHRRIHPSCSIDRSSSRSLHSHCLPRIDGTFSDGGKGGIFNPSTAMTDQTGSASTSYTLPTTSNSYALTASTPGYAAGVSRRRPFPVRPKVCFAGVLIVSPRR